MCHYPNAVTEPLADDATYVAGQLAGTHHANEE